MFELMDENRESYLQLEEQKNELEDLWKQEKEKLRVAQRVSLPSFLWIGCSLAAIVQLEIQLLHRLTAVCLQKGVALLFCG